MPSSRSVSPATSGDVGRGDSPGCSCERGIACSISRAITRAVARPIGWVRSQVVDRSITPSWRPVTGSLTGAAQQTQLCTIEA